MEIFIDMKGNVVKMEVDYSDIVDKRILECEELVVVSNLCFYLIFCCWGYCFKVILCGIFWVFCCSYFFFVVMYSYIVFIY